jgi:hypothetical protein
MALTKPRAAQIYNLDYKQATRVVSVAAVTLSGGAPSTVDGVSLSLNDRVLVTAQAIGSQNGLYKVTVVGSGSTGTWARTSDANDTGEIEAGMIIMVTEGTIYADTQWKLTTDDPIVIGTTALSFTQNYSANSITSGNSNVTVRTNANILLSSAGTANVVDIFGTGIKIIGTESVTGNTTTGNLLTGGLISATGNVTGNYFLGNVFFANGITASKVYNGTSEVNVTASGGNVNVSIGGTSNVAVFSTTGEYVTGVISASGNVTGGNVLTSGLISATANITGGNILTGGLISATGNVTGNYINGNIYFANGFSASKIFNGTSEANIGASGGNANISIGGTSNVAVFATTGEYVTGVISASGNITGGNVLTGGLISATSNITGGNILTVGFVTATGNVTGNYFIGNGSALTGINAFGTVTVSGQSNIAAVGLNAPLTFAAGSNISITTGGNTVTIAYTSTSSSSIFATGGDMGLIANPVTASEDLGNVTTVADTSYDLGTLFTTTTLNQLDMTGFTANVNTGNLNATGNVFVTGNIYQGSNANVSNAQILATLNQVIVYGLAF